ncbi:MAG: radical SAM protein [Deltaproteobacteria bacterium]|nr:radical SAM protein [Deltaproteobacteria bacterium]
MATIEAPARGLTIAMIVPPVSDLNTMYAAAPRLTGWLRAQGHTVTPIDLSLEVFLAMFSRAGLTRLFAAIDPRAVTGEYEDVYQNRDRYVRIIDDVVAFMQGKDPALAHRIVRGDFIPEGPYLREETPAARRERFGAWGKVDHARHLATQMLLDLTHLLQTISPHYALVNYAAKLSRTSASFDEIAGELARPPNAIEQLMEEAAARAIPADVDLVCLTCPFPGMLIGSLVIGRWLATHRPRAARALGGGFPSTELRELSDPRFFDFVDYLVIDDGERPLERICARVAARGGDDRDGAAITLHKTATRQGDRVVWHEDTATAAPRFRELPAPDYEGVRMDRYVHLLPVGANVFHRLLNDGPWLKLTAAHGCYWKKCTFCDVHLAYIDDFDPLSAAQLADQMDAIHAQTGLSSFHFTDEAAPPPLLVNLALELLRRDRNYQYFGNIRYDTGFTPDRCRLLAASGMIAVTGGIEVASDALLPKIRKGITIPHVTKVLQAFRGAGILCHAYLIYGFPGEALADTINSLETLRQLFGADLLQSGVFHKFSLTAHAPIAKAPELFGIRIKDEPFRGFARYDLAYDSVSVPAPDDAVFAVLDKALNAFVHGKFLDTDVRQWFRPSPVPAPTVARDFIARAMAEPHPSKDADLRVCWLGGAPRWSGGMLQVASATGEMIARTAPRALADLIARCHPSGWGKATPPRASELVDLELAASLRAHGLVSV